MKHWQERNWLKNNTTISNFLFLYDIDAKKKKKKKKKK